MTIDYSAKHNILLQNKEDGCLLSMDEPYYKINYLEYGIWQIQSEGCISYLVQGDCEAIMIDTGYGYGNIREFAQNLTKKPLNRVINTHDHFDHSALNGYFEEAIMGEKSIPLTTIPFPSFEGIVFPRDYKKVAVHEGDIIDLGNRPLRVFEVPDHAIGSIAILDSVGKTLFIGDELSPRGKDVNGYVDEAHAQLFRILKYEKYYDRICHGHMGVMNADILCGTVANLQHILEGNEGEKDSGKFFRKEKLKSDPLGQGREVWLRDAPHPGDGHPVSEDDRAYRRVSKYAGTEVRYDIRKVYGGK